MVTTSSSSGSSRLQVRCCGASGCRSAGSEPLLASLQAARQAAGLSEADLAIKSVGCLRLCGRGPLLACDGPAGTRLYGAVPPDQAGSLIRAASGGAVADGHDSLADYHLSLEHPFFALQFPVVLEGCGQVDPESIDDAVAHGTYNQLKRCLQELSPKDVRDQVRRSGLRGRGGGGYPTGLKWDTVALHAPGPPLCGLQRR
jgi:bidirectional [NiFe] hydrogenase diaphorase subunit